MKRFFGNLIIHLIFKSDDIKINLLYEYLTKKSFLIKYESFRKKYKISEDFKFNGHNIKFYGDGEIICGKNSYIGSFSTVQSAKNYKVIIGNNCSISHNVRVYTQSNVSDQNMDLNSTKEIISGDVVIGNGVWIGANVFIKQNVKIGNNSIIGANSVVIKDVEPNSIYGGVPAKFLRFKRISN